MPPKPVEPSGDDRRLVPEGGEGSLHHVRHRLAGMGHLTGRGLKLGICRPWLEDEDIDPRAPELPPQRFAEEAIETLGRTVGSQPRQRLQAGDGANDDDGAPSALLHPGEQPTREHDGGGAVYLDERA